MSIIHIFFLFFSFFLFLPFLFFFRFSLDLIHSPSRSHARLPLPASVSLLQRHSRLPPPPPPRPRAAATPASGRSLLHRGPHLRAWPAADRRRTGLGPAASARAPPLPCRGLPPAPSVPPSSVPRTRMENGEEEPLGASFFVAPAPSNGSNQRDLGKFAAGAVSRWSVW